ncbi:MAG: hypothetical protein ACK5MT_14340 [Actinomycetales bacterium]
MNTVMIPDSPGNVGHRRETTLLWISGGLAAGVLAVGLNGTLSSWVTATIANDANTAAAATSVILTETDGTATCSSTQNGGAGNSYTCSTINKYGGTTTPLLPGDSQSVTVTMSNTGTGDGALALDAGACVATGGQAATDSLCEVATVAVSCPAGTTTKAPTTLATFDADSPTSVGGLTAGSSLSCTFTVSLPAGTSPVYSGQSLTQPLTWTLSGS